MLNHSDTKDAIYDITNPSYWDKSSLDNELNRVYDICIGCRLCFNLCPSFPSLFNSIDGIGDEKRKEAEIKGIVEKEDSDRAYLDLPEGEHASEASIEVDFRGEVTELSNEQKWEVVDLCYQCKLCDPICPYTPGKEHEFELDFPKLMTRAQAIRTKDRGLKLNDVFLSKTDLLGTLGSYFGPLINFVNRISIVRWFMDKIIGIHKDRKLPELATLTFEKWFKNHKSLVEDPIDKVVIFGTCYTNSNDVDLGISAVEILEHNNVECVYPKQQCCGAPHLSPGDFDSFKKQADPNVEELYKWVSKGYKIIVTGPPTCSLTLKSEYPDYLEMSDKVQKISESTYDISEYLAMLKKEDKIKTDFKNSIGTVNYHVSCHLKAQRIGYKSRDVLRMVPDTKVNLINQCSGMDGGWGMKSEFFEESMKVADRCVNDISAKESDVACSDCSLASHQIKQASEEKIKPSHPIIELHKAYGFNDSERK